MKKISINLKSHAPWYKYHIDESSQLSSEEIEQIYLTELHKFVCGNICVIQFDNLGNIYVEFNEEQTLSDIKDVSAILLYFISLCNGFNCEYKSTAIIDGKTYQNFFSFAQEDKTFLPLLKNTKFYDISLEDIKDDLSQIIATLLAPDNRRYFLALLSNYYSLTVYKDFVGNSEYRFRNIVTNLESLITLINNDKYTTIENEHKNFLQDLREQELFSKSEMDKHILAKGVRLEEKLQDIFDYAKQFGLSLKSNSTVECHKIANTRNFISHLFKKEKVFLNREEMSNYSAALEILFRMIFLDHYGVDNALIKNKFLKNRSNQEILKQIFYIV